MGQCYYTVGRGCLVLRIQFVYRACSVWFSYLFPLYGGVGGVAATVLAKLLGYLAQFPGSSE